MAMVTIDIPKHALAVCAGRSQDLNHCRDINRVPVDARRPGAFNRCLNRLQALPDGTVALEPTAKAYHPNTVAFPHAALGLDVIELVPE